MPSSTNDPAGKETTTVTVLASEQALTINGQNVEVADLEGKIAALLANAKNEKDRVVIVSGSDDLTFQRDADILYAIQKAGGIVVISDETQKEKVVK